MGLRVLRRHIWGYSVCQCPIKRTSGLYGLSILLVSVHVVFSGVFTSVGEEISDCSAIKYLLFCGGWWGLSLLLEAFGWILYLTFHLTLTCVIECYVVQ